MRSSNSEDGAVVTLRERRWRCPCLSDLESLSLCLSGALEAWQDGDRAKRLGITLVRVGQVAVDVGRDFGVLTEPR